MAFGNEQQNREAKDGAKSNGFSIYNLEGFDPSMLKISYNQTIFNISIAPALPNAKKGDQKQFDYEKNVFTGLTLNLTAPALHDAIVNDLLPAMQTNPSSVKEVGVESAKYYIGVGNGIEYTNELRPYLVIRQFDDNRKLIGEICYEFKKSRSTINYSVNNPGAETYVERFSELNLFVSTLGNFVETMGGAAHHADRNAGYWAEKKAKEEISAIASALGIQKDEGGSRSNSNGLAGRGSYFDRQNQQSGQNFSASESSYGNMNDLEAELQNNASASMLN